MLDADADEGVWKVSITTGVYAPPGGDEINDPDTANTNNNAYDKAEKEDYVSQKRRSEKYRMAPWPPVGQLFIVVYGERGKTGSLALSSSDEPSDAEMFQPGSVDCFEVIVCIH